MSKKRNRDIDITFELNGNGINVYSVNNEVELFKLVSIMCEILRDKGYSVTETIAFFVMFMDLINNDDRRSLN